MKKLTIKSIIEFKGKSDLSKRNFVNALKLDKKKIESEGGGDYWVTSLSAISNSFKLNSLDPINDKRAELEEKVKVTKVKKTKDMYERNIHILYNYQDFDLKKWGISKKIGYEMKHKEDLTLTIKGLQIQINPQFVFKLNKGEDKEIAAIWFIAKKNGYGKDEMGMFADILYRYLKMHHSSEYSINPKYCIAVDVFNNFQVNYAQLQNGELPLILNPTLDEIKRLL